MSNDEFFLVDGSELLESGHKKFKKIFKVMIILCHGKFQASNGFLDALCM
jgi:hypothetical protein